MKTQILKLNHNGEWKVIRDSEAKCNPYSIIHIRRELTDHGVVKRRKQVVKYANLASCMYYLFDMTQNNDRE